MPRQSLKILTGLVGAAILLSGWLFAWPWKREVSQLRQQLEGTAFTPEEQILIDLQDQLEASRNENERLNEELRKLSELLEAQKREPVEED